VLLDEKKYDEALKQLDAATAKEFEALVADRRGDVLLAQGKKDEAKAAYTRAWQAMDARVEYRRLIDAKLTALGAAPAAAASAASAAAGQ
jgi:predicted negative regulator of RcsB-dependent stress response